MINELDIQEIDERYFWIVTIEAYYVVIVSKNTGHYWQLLEQIANEHRTFMIRHKHNKPDPYHVQTNRSTLADCCKYIQSHDNYHMEKVRKRKERRIQRLISNGRFDLLPIEHAQYYK